jgi:hypothetical protein
MRSEWSDKSVAIGPEVFVARRQVHPRTTPFEDGAEPKTFAAKEP